MGRKGSKRRAVVSARATMLLAAALLAGCGAAPPGAGGGALRVDDGPPAVSQDSRVLFVVLHYTDETLDGSLRALTQGPVSAHYLVTDGSDGRAPRVLRLVPEERRAWHAGASEWQGHAMLNASSIGIEIVHPGPARQPGGGLVFADWPDAQVDAVVALVRDIVRRHGVRPDRVVGHSDVAPLRKIDPGPNFPWERLAREGLAVRPDAARVRDARPRFDAVLPDAAWFQRRLAAVGYRVPRHGALDDETRRVLAAFQMRFRPARFDGEPDAESAAILQALGPDDETRP